MSRKKDYCMPVRISQEGNGYILELGWSSCSAETDRFVFQSFTELVNYLNDHFDFRNELIYTDMSNQISINLKS